MVGGGGERFVLLMECFVFFNFEGKGGGTYDTFHMLGHYYSHPSKPPIVFIIVPTFSNNKNGAGLQRRKIHLHSRAALGFPYPLGS